MALTKVHSRMVNELPVNVKDFGAVGDGTTDDTAAIKAAVAAAQHDGSPTHYGRSVYFPSGTYLLKETIYSGSSLFIDGDPNAVIKAGSTFVGKTVTDATTSSDIELKAMFAVFEGTTVNTTSGGRVAAEDRPASVFKKITIECNDVAEYGIFVERAPYTRVEANVFNCTKTAIHFGPYSWCCTAIGSKIYGATDIGIYLGDASNGTVVEECAIWGGGSKTTNYGVWSDGNNNGVRISGGFIEKCQYGFIADDKIAGYERHGPHHLTGIDFEAITENAIKVIGDGTGGRSMGPFYVSGCYVDSTEENVYVDQCTVILEACRFRNVAATSGDHIFTSNNGLSRVIARETTGDASGANVPLTYDDSFNIVDEKVSSGGYKITNKKWDDPTSFHGVYEISNFAVRTQAFETGNFKFEQRNDGGVNNLHPSRSQWSISQTHAPSGTPAVYNTIGVQLQALGSTTNAFTPLADNTIELGESSYRFKEVFAVTGTINTSDQNEKQQIRDLNATEQTVATNLKTKIKAFKWNDAVAEKGDNARIHVGAIAQEVEQVFIDAGLDPADYAVFCRDVKYFKDGEPVLPDDDGNYPDDAVMEERRGLRYDQLWAFIISAL